MNLLRSDGIVSMIQRALNMVDVRLVDHGIRVALVFDAMLQMAQTYDLKTRQRLNIVALMHDIGAYRTEEIDRMVTFETQSVWEHAVYGYLFLRDLSPLGRWADIVLYHHMRYSNFSGVDQEIARLSQMLHVADRADVFILSRRQKGRKELVAHLRKEAGGLFSPEAVDLFEAAELRYNLSARLRNGVSLSEVFEDEAVTEQEAAMYLAMLVHAIDFRSHYTVTHTVNTTQISRLIAIRLGLSAEETDQIYNGALLHDLGKIGIPLEILEKPGKLTPDEMDVMRTHVDLTEQIIGGCVDESVARIALRHHEKLDGTGYPRGLSAEQLTRSERIVAVSDIVSALSGARSYKDSFPKEKILSIIGGMRDKGQLDADVVRCMELHFDDIAADAAHFFIPVVETYERITQEYSLLLQRFSGL